MGGLLSRPSSFGWKDWEVRDAHMQFKMYMTTGSSDLSNKCLIRAGRGKNFEEKGG